MGCTLKNPGARRALITLTALVAFATAAGSYARPTREQQCQAGKNKTAGKYAACRENAEAKFATSGHTTKYGEAITKCADKFATAWQKLEDKALDAGTACPSVGDAAGIDGRISATTDAIAARTGGNRFEDNGDGTVTDNVTGLQWEKKNGAGGGANLANPHDVDNIYSWNPDGGATPSGTAFTDFLGRLNNCTAGSLLNFSGFAFRCDWRLPSLAELQGILLEPQLCGTNPCIDPIFGATAADGYWTSTTETDHSGNAWNLYFGSGGLGPGSGSKNILLRVRAVRGGL